MKAELIPLDGGDPIPITKDVTLIGRREYCDIQIDHPSLSKRHCVLVKTDGLLVIRDLATTNGTKVKGQKIRWAALLPDDRIALGSIKFRVHLGPDVVLLPPEPPARVKPEPASMAPVVPAPPGPAPAPAPARGPDPWAPPPSKRKSARPEAPPIFEEEEEEAEVDFPLALDEGAWRDALGPDSSEIPKSIDLD